MKLNKHISFLFTSAWLCIALLAGCNGSANPVTPPSSGKVNACTSKTPCKNGGTCNPVGTSDYTCTCAGDFKGKNCEVAKDYCDLNSNPCQNGGTCVGNGTSDYTCTCAGDFKGKNCDVPKDYCDLHPDTCQNGGTCNPVGASSFICECPPSYGGQTCESKPCETKNGGCSPTSACLVENGVVRCVCADGFTGTHCDEPNDQCQNGGKYGLLVTGKQGCVCPDGYVGTHCEIPPSACNGHFCEHGLCIVNSKGIPSCDCGDSGFKGAKCETPVNVCTTNPCQNGGNCYEDPATKQAACRCLPGYQGDRCETPPASLPQPFKIKVRVKKDNDKFIIYTNPFFKYNYRVKCDDTSSDPETGILTGKYICSYKTAGDYVISITGLFPAPNIGDASLTTGVPKNADNAEKLLEVVEWGDQEWKSMASAFAGATNLTAIPAVTSSSPNTSAVKDMSFMFAGCSSFNSPLNDLDISKVAMMNALFKGASKFNQSLDKWNVSHVAKMVGIFEDAAAFNQNLTAWDTINVPKGGCKDFNKGASAWDASNQFPHTECE